MLDVYSGLTQQYASFGGHIELIEVDELANMRKDFIDNDVQSQLLEFYGVFDVLEDYEVA